MTDDRPLNPLEAEAARLRDRYPGWRVWYVPRVGRGAWWSAQPAHIPSSLTARTSWPR